MEKGDFVLRNLDFQQALAFFAAVECGSFTKAAEKLHTSQAAVSRMIARLEQETGLILFVRKARVQLLPGAETDDAEVRRVDPALMCLQVFLRRVPGQVDI